MTHHLIGKLRLMLVHHFAIRIVLDNASVFIRDKCAIFVANTPHHQCWLFRAVLISNS